MLEGPRKIRGTKEGQRDIGGQRGEGKRDKGGSEGQMKVRETGKHQIDRRSYAKKVRWTESQMNKGRSKGWKRYEGQSQVIRATKG